MTTPKSNRERAEELHRETCGICLHMPHDADLSLCKYSSLAVQVLTRELDAKDAAANARVEAVVRAVEEAWCFAEDQDKCDCCKNKNDLLAAARAAAEGK